jgi:hypothetical protein
VLSGAVSVGDSASLTLAFRDPRAAYLAALGDALRERGIAVRGVAVPSVENQGAAPAPGAGAVRKEPAVAGAVR